MAWQLHDARQRFSALVRQTLDEGPQVVTRRGEEVVVVLSAAEYRRLTRTVPDFAQFLLNGPGFSQFELWRDTKPVSPR